MVDFTCAEFRAKRDYFQAVRRFQVLPQLEAAEIALKAKIGAYKRKMDRLSKHDKQAVESGYVALWQQYSENHAQLAVIREWLPSVPDHLKAQVFEVGKVA